MPPTPGASVAVLGVVLKSTVTAAAAAALSETVNVRLVVPALPSVIVASLIDRPGSAPSSLLIVPVPTSATSAALVGLVSVTVMF